MPQRLKSLERLTAALGDAVTVDDVARAALNEFMNVEHVIRAGIAVSRGAGRELSFVSTDEDALNALSVRWCPIDGLADVPVARTVRTSSAVYLGTPEDLDHQFPAIAARQRRMGTQSMASVPMTVEGACVGGLMVSFDVTQDFAFEQQAFLGAYAAQVSQALRRALAYQVQRSTSEQLQRSLMPHSLPELPGLALGAQYRPGGVNADVGGDWYDVMTLPDGSVVVVLGDVMGRGVPAAIVMSEIRSAIRAYALLDPDPAVVLERLERMVSAMPFADQIVTVLYGLVDPERTSVRLAVAGHPPPLLVSPEGRPRLLDTETGPALGLGAGPWPISTVQLENYATLLFYSDGLVETRQQDLFSGIDALRDLVEQLPARRRNPRELCARLGELMRAADADDDVTMLAVTAAPSQPTASRELPADASAPGLARRFVTSVLKDWEVDEDAVGTAELCVSELVTNAVIHTATKSTVTVRTDGEYLLVMVQDQGGPGSVRQAEDLEPEAISGRGLALVDALTSAWSSEHNTDGTTVWFEIPLGTSPLMEPVPENDMAT
jgi:serine phosphatase RsbU (regulator of sigma subunit)/anti-sigma regulatory factor (Ser/Thr protein kinase)